MQRFDLQLWTRIGAMNPGSAGVSPASCCAEMWNAPAGRQRSQVGFAGRAGMAYETETEAALKMRRQLVEENRDAYLPALAETLNELAGFHRDEQRMADARLAVEEALKVNRELVDKNPDANLPALAKSLNNLGVLGRHEQRVADARTTFEEALKIYQRARRKIAPALSAATWSRIQGMLRSLRE